MSDLNHSHTNNHQSYPQQPVIINNNPNPNDSKHPTPKVPSAPLPPPVQLTATATTTASKPSSLSDSKSSNKQSNAIAPPPLYPSLFEALRTIPSSSSSAFPFGMPAPPKLPSSSSTTATGSVQRKNSQSSPSSSGAATTMTTTASPPTPSSLISSSASNNNNNNHFKNAMKRKDSTVTTGAPRRTSISYTSPVAPPSSNQPPPSSMPSFPSSSSTDPMMMNDFSSGPFAFPSIASFAPLFETKGIPQPPPSMLYSEIPKPPSSSKSRKTKSSPSTHSSPSSWPKPNPPSLVVSGDLNPNHSSSLSLSSSASLNHFESAANKRRKPSQPIEELLSSNEGIIKQQVDYGNDSEQQSIKDPFAIRRRQDQFQPVPHLPTMIDPYNLPAFYSFFRHEKGLVDVDGSNKDVGIVMRLDERMKSVDLPVRAQLTIHEVTKQYFPALKVQCWLCETLMNQIGEVDASGLSVLLDVPVPVEESPCLLSFDIPPFHYTGKNFNNKNVRQYFRFVLINTTTNTMVSFVDSALFSMKFESDHASIDQQAAKKIQNALQSFQAISQLGRAAPPPPPLNPNVEQSEQWTREKFVEVSVENLSFQSELFSELVRKPEQRDFETVRNILAKVLTHGKWHKMLCDLDLFQSTSSHSDHQLKRTYQPKLKHSAKRMAYDPTLIYPNKRARYIPDYQQFLIKPACILSLCDSYGPTVGGTSVQIYVNELDLIDPDGLTLRFGSITVPREDIFYVSPNEVRCLLPPQFEEGNYDVSISVDDEVQGFSFVHKEGFKYVQLGQYINRKREAGEPFCTDILQMKNPMLMFSSVALDESLLNAAETNQLYSLTRGEKRHSISPSVTPCEEGEDCSFILYAHYKDGTTVEVNLEEQGGKVRVADEIRYEIVATFSNHNKSYQVPHSVDKIQWFIKSGTKNNSKEPTQISSAEVDNRDRGRLISKDDEFTTIHIPIVLNDDIISKYKGLKKLVLQLVDSESQKTVYTSKNIVFHTRKQYNRSPKGETQETRELKQYHQTLKEQSRNYIQHVQMAQWNSMGQSPLHRACFSGSIREIEGAIRDGYSATTCDYFDRTPMHYAFASGYLNAAKHLLRRMPESLETLLYEDFYYLTPFHLGVKYNRIEFLDEISDFIRKEFQLFSMKQPPTIIVTDTNNDTENHSIHVETKELKQEEILQPYVDILPEQNNSSGEEEEAIIEQTNSLSSIATPESPCEITPCSQHCKGDCPPLQIEQSATITNARPTTKTPNLAPISTLRTSHIAPSDDEDQLFVATITPFRNRSVQDLRAVEEMNKHPYKYQVRLSASMDKVLFDPSLRTLPNMLVYWELYSENGDHIPNGVNSLSKPEIIFKEGVGVNIEVSFSLMYCSHNLKNSRFVLKLLCASVLDPNVTRVLYSSNPITVYARRRTGDPSSSKNSKTSEGKQQELEQDTSSSESTVASDNSFTQSASVHQDEPAYVTTNYQTNNW